MNDFANWHLNRVSQTCKIKNLMGTFDLCVYELLNSEGKEATVLALSMGVAGENLLVRINSACMTSEILGDLRCECNWQLWESLRLISLESRGLLLYAPADEGRGAGIFNKVNSMRLMAEAKVGSSEAFRRLGLAIDYRDYRYTLPIFRHLGIVSIRCITNNPAKLDSLTQGGVRLVATIPIVAPTNQEIERCIQDKVTAQGHKFIPFAADGENQ